MRNEESELIIGYLQGTLSSQETDAFYSWVNESEEHKKLFFEAKAIYDASRADTPSADIQESWNRLLQKHKRMERRSNAFYLSNRNKWFSLGKYAAVALVAVWITSAFFLFYEDQNISWITRYIGGDGLEADTVVLPDGTKVSLGSKTTFYCEQNYGKKERVVHLSGEAYFEVVKQKEKPFIVKVKGQQIEALGTKFNVMAYPLDSLFTTTLLEGCVRLTIDSVSVPTVLKPDQQLVYNRNTNDVLVSHVNASQFTSWTTGYYYFPEQSLQAILYRLGHVYGIDFQVQSERLNQQIFTGTFYRGQSVKNIMEIINLSIPIHYVIEDHRVTITE